MTKLNKTLLALGLASVVAGTAPAMAATTLSLTVSDFVLVTDPNTPSDQSIALGEWEGHRPWKALTFTVPEDFGPNNLRQPYEVVLQLNLSSTNKSPYNALYLNPEGFSSRTFRGCDDVQNDRYEPERIGFLPYVNHEDWRVYHKTMTSSNLRPGENVLLICARNEQGGGGNDLDNFYLKDIVLHYRKRIAFGQ
ncbi:MAG: hypothetical protein WAT93_08240 [Pontixanthobacter sp.]